MLHPTQLTLAGELLVSASCCCISLTRCLPGPAVLTPMPYPMFWLSSLQSQTLWLGYLPGC